MTNTGSEPRFVTRAQELMASGTPFLEAWSRADMEEMLRRWPAEWGDELEVLIGGDFKPPEANLVMPSLGITVFREKQRNDAFCGALAVVRARIAVSERSLAGYNDAIRRLNILLGSHSVAAWGASGLAWWCWLWGVIGGGSRIEPFGTIADPLNRCLDRLPARTRPRVEAALYWLREPRGHLGEKSRPDAVRCFLSYWTAFECLVSAGCDLVPMPPTPDEDVRQAISSLSGDGLSVEALRRAYRLAEPALPDRARHVFREFLPGTAERLIEECFTVSPSDRRLAVIRNSISHGGAKPEGLGCVGRVRSSRSASASGCVASP